MTELELLATRRDARVAVLGPADVVSKYIAETEKNLAATLADAERPARSSSSTRPTVSSAGSARSRRTTGPS